MLVKLRHYPDLVYEYLLVGHTIVSEGPAMKKLVASLLLALVAMTASASVALAERVSGYQRRDGTYVQPYNRSNRDNTVTNNYSYVGNVNPYTGTEGNNYYRNSPSSPYYDGTPRRRRGY